LVFWNLNHCYRKSAENKRKESHKSVEKWICTSTNKRK
jgi:hypothetical protein